MQFRHFTTDLPMRVTLLLASLLIAGCAGYRGGWESVAYLGDRPPATLEQAATRPEALRPPELKVSGLTMQVTIDNRLRTHDRQTIAVVPVSVDPRKAYPKNVEPGKTRVFVTVTASTPEYVFRPAAAILKVGAEQFSGAAGFEFGMWDERWNRVEQGGRWEHRPVGSEFVLADVGRRYYLSIDFATPTPSPQLPDIVLDLSQALTSTAQSPLPLIRFTPVRWKEGYT